MTYLAFAAIGFLLALGITRNIFAGLLNAIILGLLSVAFTPTLALNFIDPYVMLLFGCIVPALVVFNSSKDSIGREATAIVVPALLFVALVFGGIGSAEFMRGEAYRDLLGQVSEGDLAADLEVLDQTQARTVDAKLAEKRAHELLGSDPGLGSRVNVGTFVPQEVNGRVYLVAPLEHSGFFKWKDNGTTPGYVMVSVSDYRDAKLVTELDGKPLALRYGYGGYFDDNIERHVYQGGHATQGLTDFSFALDPTGRPFWVVTVYEHKIGFGGSDVTGVVLVDAQTGTMTDYAIANLPKWVNNVQPESLVEQQVKWWGEYVHGAFNWGGNDQLKPTKGITMVPTKDGRTVWYMGIQTMGRDDGTVGFMLVDTRTKKVVMYHQAGAAEDAAVLAIQGAVQAQHYSATDPVLYNVDGTPTYLSTLKDAAGNFKGVGLMAVTDRSTVATGDDVAQALNAYMGKLRRHNVALNAKAEHSVAEGNVVRIARDTTGTATTIYLMLDTVTDRVFAGAASSTSLALMLAKEGDHVKVTYVDDGSDVEAIDGLEDNGVRLRSSAAQSVVDSDARVTAKALAKPTTKR